MLRLLSSKARHAAVAPQVPQVRWGSDAAMGAGASSVEPPTLPPPPPATLPTDAEVVIIGGGSAGCNTLYQLAKRGVKAVLLERSRLTSGTTWHTAGLIWRLRPSDVEVQLLNTTRDLLMSLEAETGINPGWINNGGLYIAHTEERMMEYRRLASVARSFGIEASVLDPSGVKEVFPLIDEKQVLGGLHTPGDGVVDPAGVCSALVKAATRNGAQVIENCDVKQILMKEQDLGPKKVTGLVTNMGTIRTDCVINCAGVWSREVAKMAGVSLPIVPMRHAYVVSEEMGVRGLPNVRDHDWSLYFRVQGDSLCVGGYESNPDMLTDVSPEFSFGLYELDWNIFGAHVTGAVNLCPAFETAGIKSTVCGPESFTPDHKPLIGEDPLKRGLFHGCGFNSAGMMLGGGCGEQLALWVMHGRPDLHMQAYDIRRFADVQRTDREWIKERSHEAYCKNYSIVFPHDEPLAGRNLIQNPFNEELLAAGAVFEERQGWERPGWYCGTPAPLPKYDWYGAYGSTRHKVTRYEKLLKADYTFDFPRHHETIREEALACREASALFEMSYFGKLYITGPDAQAAADWVFSANTSKPLNSTVYTCILNKLGRVEGDVTVSVVQTGQGSPADPIFRGRGFYVVSGGATSQHTHAHVLQALHERGFRVDVEDVTNRIGVLSVQGPNSRELLQGLVDVDLDDTSFPMSTTQMVKIAGHRVRAIRLSFVGELGWELHIPVESCQAVYKAVRAAGQRYDLRMAGYRAMYSLSAEKGYHLWHSDLRSDDNPLEANLGFTCRSTGDYQGKQAVEAVRKSGLRKKLAFFTLSDKVRLNGLEAIVRDGLVVGYLRRGDYGFSLDCPIGTGYVTHPDGQNVTDEFLSDGKYQLEVMGQLYDAKLHLRSPFDPENDRVKGLYRE